MPQWLFGIKRFMRYFVVMRKTLGIIGLIIWIISTTHCAKRGTPSGGSKDSLPPVLIKATPPFETTNFDAQKIILNFDEYVKLNNIDEQLIVSPPMEKSDYQILPEGTVSKKVEIRFKNPPRDKTTFTFNFGSAIEDYNEGNQLPYFYYTFSTGDYIDSLQLSGNVMDAFEIDSLSKISIHLYPIDSTYTDSTIYLQKPFYVGNTLDSIYFKLNNLAPGKYEFLAIDDVGKNYLFDQNIDKIGFFSEPIELPQDSIVFPFLFKEITNFSWGRPRFVNDHHLEFGYFGEVGDRRVQFDSAFTAKGKGFFTQDREKDTLHYWFRPQKDLDSLIVQFEENDSLRPYVIKPFKLIEDSLEIKFEQRNGGILHFLDTLKLKANLPIATVNEEFIQIFDIDTLEVPFSTRIDENKDYLYFDFDRVPNDVYRLQLFPNAIVDFMGGTMDTLNHRVKTVKVEDYGNLFLTIDRKDPELTYFLELLNSKMEVVRKIEQNENDYYVLEYLLPSNYQIRLVKDRNKNGKRDTGNYLEKRQPEEVVYLPAPLSLRANWDLNETFTIPE